MRSMLIDNPFGYGQTEAAPPAFTLAGRIAAIETVKNMRQLLRTHAATFILNIKGRFPSLSSIGLQMNRTSLRGLTPGIVRKNSQNLFQQQAVSLNPE